MSEPSGSESSSPGGAGAIADYGLIGDRHTAALVSRSGSIDWLCLPRFDSGACFARLLGGDRAGFCRVAPVEAARVARRYRDGTMILCTEFAIDPSGDRPDGGARALLTDFMVSPERVEGRTLIRLLTALEGRLDYRVDLRVRFDYGAVRPWLRELGDGTFSLVGGDDGLLVWSDAGLRPVEGHDLLAAGSLAAGQRICLSLTDLDPVRLDRGPPERIAGRGDAEELLEATAAWWSESADRCRVEGALAEPVRRSALILRALTYEPTGAVVAAATTSLPETIGGRRNWDYRYSWVRDSVLAVSALAEVGLEDEARDFRRFVERSAAGHAADLQILFGVGGERRIVEWEVAELDGYRGSRPVRVGNGAHDQLQLDAFGQIVNQAWHWLRRGERPEPDYWPFLRDLVEAAARHWREPDAGLWEWRADPRHFVHSKALCWAALARGLEIAAELEAEVPERRWRETAEEIHATVIARGFDPDRGTFLQAFDGRALDAAVLRLPTVGFVAWRDPRMVSTAETIARELDDGGLLRRHSGDDGLEGREGAFLPCSFWLVTCLAHQGRRQTALELFERTTARANDLGLLSEQYDPGQGEMLGNFPQALTHLSQIEAGLALRDTDGRPG